MTVRPSCRTDVQVDAEQRGTRSGINIVGGRPPPAIYKVSFITFLLVAEFQGRLESLGTSNRGQMPWTIDVVDFLTVSLPERQDLRARFYQAAVLPAGRPCAPW
jgi:hypothetical protein